MLLISDTGPIISLLLIKKFNLLSEIFSEYYIPKAVLDELTSHREISVYKDELLKLNMHSKEVPYYAPISGIDIGETEAIYLYIESHADFLLIDDKKAREKAELLSVNCIGTLGLLYLAYRKKKIEELRPLFILLREHKRYYSLSYLNLFLNQVGEVPL